MTRLYQSIVIFIYSRPGEDNALLFEMTITRLIHALAHHPDFSISIQDLQIFAIYIDLFFDCVANADNVSFLYYVVTRIKMVSDATFPDASDVSFCAIFISYSSSDNMDEYSNVTWITCWNDTRICMCWAILPPCGSITEANRRRGPKQPTRDKFACSLICSNLWGVRLYKKR